jgi:hypothetical protein
MKAYFIVPIRETDPIHDSQMAVPKLPPQFANYAAAETVCAMMNEYRGTGHAGYKIEEREIE